MRSLLCWLVLSSALLAQDPAPTPAPVGPKAVITDSNGNPPPASVVAGEVLYLSAAQSVAGTKPTSIIWVIEPKVRAERSKVFGKEVCIPLGKVDCTLVVTQIVALGDEAAYTTVTIQIDGDDIKPGPTPDPDPVPVVDGLTKLVVGELKPILDKPENKNLQTQLAFGALSAAYKQLAGEVKEGKFTKIDDLLIKTSAMSRAALGNHLPLWKGTDAAPGLILRVEKELERRQPDLKSHEALYLEIAKGIDLALGV